ncbi:hypothetical protein VTO73DRAFT_2900 [Trametes versicolor]
MQRVDPPYPSISSVFSTPQPRNTRSCRLPAYRSSHAGRYHPYPMYGRVSCQERLMSTSDRRYEQALLWEAEEPLVVPPQPRVTTCTEVPDPDACPFEDEPLLTEDPEDEPELANTAPPAAASPMLVVDVLAALLAALRQRYFERLRALKEFLLLEQ